MNGPKFGGQVIGKTWLACALAQAACRDGVGPLHT
ncbi:ATP-binding protein [Roseovarius sp. ZX-A-9]